METINYESREYTTVNSYIGAEGNDRKEWFDGLKFDKVYLDYDEEVYSNTEEYDSIVHNVLDNVLDVFDSAVSRVTDEIDRRYELLTEIDSNGTSRDGAVPLLYDTVEKKVVTLSEITDIAESMLPDAVPATAYINPSYSWENGWEYDKKEITIPIDYNVGMEFEKAFEYIKREADELIAKADGIKFAIESSLTAEEKSFTLTEQEKQLVILLQNQLNTNETYYGWKDSRNTGMCVGILEALNTISEDKWFGFSETEINCKDSFGNVFRNVMNIIERQDMEKDISFEDLSNKIQFADKHEYGYELFLDNSAGKEFIDALGDRATKAGMWKESEGNTYPDDDLSFSEALNLEICSVSKFETQVHISIELGDSTDVRAEMVAVDNEGNSVTAEIPLRTTEKEAIINEIAVSKEAERKVSENQEKNKQPKQKKSKDDYER